MKTFRDKKVLEGFNYRPNIFPVMYYRIEIYLNINLNMK